MFANLPKSQKVYKLRYIFEKFSALKIVDGLQLYKYRKKFPKFEQRNCLNVAQTFTQDNMINMINVYIFKNL